MENRYYTLEGNKYGLKKNPDGTIRNDAYLKFSGALSEYLDVSNQDDINYQEVFGSITKAGVAFVGNGNSTKSAESKISKTSRAAAQKKARQEARQKARQKAQNKFARDILASFRKEANKRRRRRSQPDTTPTKSLRSPVAPRTPNAPERRTRNAPPPPPLNLGANQRR